MKTFCCIAKHLIYVVKLTHMSCHYYFHFHYFKQEQLSCNQTNQSPIRLSMRDQCFMPDFNHNLEKEKRLYGHPCQAIYMYLCQYFPCLPCTMQVVLPICHTLPLLALPIRLPIIIANNLTYASGCHALYCPFNVILAQILAWHCLRICTLPHLLICHAPCDIFLCLLL